jgi:hypothetical protein
MLEQAIGYAGDSPDFNPEWMAFYYQSTEAFWDTGLRSATGEWYPLLYLYLRHRAVAPYVAPYDFGSDDAPPAHWLVLNRRTRTMYVVEAHLAERFVMAQWDLPETPSAPFVVADTAELNRLAQEAVMAALGAAWQEVSTDADLQAHVAERMRAQDEANHALAAWLDDYARQHERTN